MDQHDNRLRKSTTKKNKKKYFFFLQKVFESTYIPGHNNKKETLKKYQPLYSCQPWRLMLCLNL